ncbi:hypothetical protein Vretimale_4634 [Volvox reticuliferus]|uniref:Uncharacterized protein n=1 Tax=Volvox reticuliferus TaxID=1737510 RepID=A0A8J4FG15_9CHLO|nr:hypothetical protein Vretifemale_3375 [Volvox reticuliferus]GIL99654.1 hypothetical protein Vretimale_4634 [Volvox reticuliferus]
MGSLVPGWDANTGVPRDLMPDSDIDKEPQPEGYFARLRSHRHTSGGPEDDAAASSLARVSAPQYLSRSHPKQAAVQRSSTLTQPVRQGLGGPQKYQFTDWSEELSTLRKGSLGRSSLNAHEEMHAHGHEGGAAWWRALEVGQLNEHPDAALNDTHGSQHSTFVPQFTQSKKLDFGDSGSK